MITRKQLFDIAFDVSQGHVATEDMAMSCSACGRVLLYVPRGDSYFTSLKGVCDCAWNCCDAARPRVHKAHFAHTSTKHALNMPPYQLDGTLETFQYAGGLL